MDRDDTFLARNMAPPMQSEHDGFMNLSGKYRWVILIDFVEGTRSVVNEIIKAWILYYSIWKASSSNSEISNAVFQKWFNDALVSDDVQSDILHPAIYFEETPNLRLVEYIWYRACHSLSLHLSFATNTSLSKH